MRRRLWTSAAFALGLFAVASAQPPAGKDAKDAKAPKEGKKTDPADAAVAAALANDPDVQVARAKVQLAEAELTKAKQAVVLRVMTLKATIQEHTATADAARQRFAFIERQARQGMAAQTELIQARAALEQALAALARAETELKLITGGGGQPAGVGAGGDPDAFARWSALPYLQLTTKADQQSYLEALAAQYAGAKTPAVKGPIPDRIRAALDKPVKLGAKGEKVTFDKALEVFKKEAGLDVPVRGPGDLIQSPVIVSQGEELPVGAWFQLFEDYSGSRVRLYVRDYGLLFTAKDAAPPDAPTLTEFWKQLPPEKKPDPAPDPKKK
jgi:hypothetical protein